MVRLLKGSKLTWVLALVGCLGVTSLYGARLYAQTRVPGAATSEAAARAFMSFMVAPDASRYRESDALGGLAAQKDLDLLGHDGANQLFLELYRESLVDRWKAESTVNDKGDNAIVEFTPNNTLKPVVCVLEEGTWRVSLIATFARWNDLDAPQSLRRISDITGAIIPGVPLNANTANAICQGNLKQITLGLLMYTQDYDDTYPPANKWCDVLQPYLKDEKLYRCPAVAPKEYGYAMNWKFSRQKLAAVAAPNTTINLYESNILRRNINGDGKDLAFRHELEAGLGANYAFADGHIGWRKQGDAQEFRLAPPKPAPSRRKTVKTPQY